MIVPAIRRRTLTMIVLEQNDDGTLHAHAHFARDATVEAGPNDTLGGLLDVLQRNILDSGALERARKA